MSYRLKPRLWMALPVILLLEVICVIVVPMLFSSYVGSDESRIWVLLAAISLTVLAVFVPVFAVLGWLRPVIFEPQRVRDVGLFVLSMSPMIALAFWAAVGGFDWVGDMSIPIILSALQAALSEEFVYRGAAIFLLRTRLAEIWVALIPAVLFGLVHLSNLTTGQSLGDTVYQVTTAAFFGLSMYAIRRVSGSIILCVVVHFLNNALPEFFYWEGAPVVLALGEVQLTWPEIILEIATLLGAIAAVIIALRFPRVPVLPTYGAAPAASHGSGSNPTA
ncbi:CPBP family intramembrane glutamic endopeptidase [Microbacterium sp. SA39]|uniref:CPBP family intramembrane glutamic endopeptidase n=1 Tax=Microbacterium sp. SA39 TaxID=1263625 RepID=UPI00061F228E|nr:CPBP family intramembrane glutamic endopeptidase [Microbacterium sp. SA39]KJQ52897.1 CAAX amino terminal protease self- immunity [Microbacterium sp. SA39]